MTHTEILQALIERTRNDFVSYFKEPARAARATELVAWALGGDQRLAAARTELEAMLPDTEDDGRWECSYALNTGAMMVCQIDYLSTRVERHFDQAVTLFFDTVDFKVQQLLEAQNVFDAAEPQIRNHPYYVAERDWYAHLSGQKHSRAWAESSRPAPAMRLTTRGIVYHPERTPNLTDTFCFSIAGVSAEAFTEALLTDLVPGQEVALSDPGPGDCSRMIRRSAAGYQTRRICHGSFTDPWRDVTREQASEWTLPCAKLMLRLKSADGYLYLYSDDDS